MFGLVRMELFFDFGHHAIEVTKIVFELCDINFLYDRKEGTMVEEPENSLLKQRKHVSEDSIIPILNAHQE